MGKDVELIFTQAICTKDFNPAYIKRLKENVLPEIMNKRFLGVEPPPNWQLLTDSLMQECYHGENICLPQGQDKVSLCLASNIPIIMIVFYPWYEQSCDILNKTIIKNWNGKKKTIIQLILNQRY